jgi:DNA-binding NtrC family response regulator
MKILKGDYTGEESENLRLQILSYVHQKDPQSLENMPPKFDNFCKFINAHHGGQKITLHSLKLEASRMFRGRKHLPPYNENTMTHIVGKGLGFGKIMNSIMQVSAVDSTVLITGEMGTGKYPIAREIAIRSKREGPFVTFDCPNHKGNLFTSALYGYEKGAFTDARTEKPGLFEISHNGTFLFDEISHLPMDHQSQINSILDSKTVMRIGAISEKEINTRIIGATRMDLKSMVNDEKFNEDLYYRFNCLRIDVPPLRGRKNDIRILVDYYASVFCIEYGIDDAKIDQIFSPAVMSDMEAYHWPGNIREVKNIVERSIVTEKFSRKYLDGKPAERIIPVDDIVTLEEQEKEYIQSVISNLYGERDVNMSELGRKLGASTSTIREKLRKYGIAYRHAH